MTNKQVYLFLPESIRKFVLPGKCGVYVLGEMIDGEFVVKYVGRSDSCLRTRLLTHNYLYSYSYFYFLYMDSPEDAFRLESQWWHACVDFDIPIINKIHPDSPVNAGLVCPYCQFAQSVKQSVSGDWLMAS